MTDLEDCKYQNFTCLFPIVTKLPLSENAIALILAETLLDAYFKFNLQSQTLTIISCCDPTETKYFWLGEKAYTKK